MVFKVKKSGINVSRVTNKAVEAPASKKQIIACVVLWILVMTTGLSVIFSTHKSRQLLNDLESKRRTVNSLHVEWNQYLLEYSAWAAYSHVEVEAQRKLDMQIPDIENLVLIEH
jgi:cell division protein FtsL